MSKSDFKVYLDLISEPYSRFGDVREHANRKQNNEGNVVVATELEIEGQGMQGEGLVTYLWEIPSLYFDEDFAFEKGSTFQEAWSSSQWDRHLRVGLDASLVGHLDVRVLLKVSIGNCVGDLIAKLIGVNRPWQDRWKIKQMDGRMDDGTDGWMDGKLHEKQPWSPLLYVIIFYFFKKIENKLTMFTKIQNI